MHCWENLTHARFPFVVKESTSALAKKTPLHHEQKLGCRSFPYSTRIGQFPKIECHYKGNITHPNFSSLKSINTLPWNILHHEVKLTHGSIPKNIVSPWRKSNACQLSFYHEGKHKQKCIEKQHMVSIFIS